MEDRFEKLIEDFKSIGFEIEDDIYTLDKVTYQTTIINGRKYQQPEHHIFRMKYYGVGCEVDDSDENVEGSEFYEFGIINNDETLTTICIRDIEEFKEYIDI